MMNEWWLTETAAAFWELAGPDNSSDFKMAVMYTLPLNPEWIPGLTLHKALEWLNRHDFPTADLHRLKDRPLRACLVASSPATSYVFLDATDDQVEQQFSLAHEIAHYLLDCVQPHQLAQQVSPEIFQVLDGQRQPTLVERLEAVLQGVRLQPHFHFMERDSRGSILSDTVLQAEDRADRLALELLAPQDAALKVVKASIEGVSPYSARLEAAQAALLDRFGLPNSVVRNYASQLVESAGGRESFMEWLTH